MSETKVYYTPDEVAARLGLHVRTIRRFIREGRLTAARVGKQYRITEGDLRQLIGTNPAKEQVDAQNRRRRIIVSTTVDIDAIDQTAQERLVSLVSGAFYSLNDQRDNRRFDSIYYAEEARLRLLINADLDITNAVLGMIRGVVEDRKSE